MNELITEIINQISFRVVKFNLSGKNIPKMITIEHIRYIIGIEINTLEPGNGNKLFIISISMTNNKINKMGTEEFIKVFLISYFCYTKKRILHHSLV